MKMNYIDNYDPLRLGCLVTLYPVLFVRAHTLMFAQLQNCLTFISQKAPASLVKHMLKYTLSGS